MDHQEPQEDKKEEDEEKDEDEGSTQRHGYILLHNLLHSGGDGNFMLPI